MDDTLRSIAAFISILGALIGLLSQCNSSSSLSNDNDEKDKSIKIEVHIKNDSGNKEQIFNQDTLKDIPPQQKPSINIPSSSQSPEFPYSKNNCSDNPQPVQIADDMLYIPEPCKK